MRELREQKKQGATSSEDERGPSKKTTSPTRKVPEKKTTAPTKIDIFVLRHGEADSRMTVEEDSKRPLTPGGRVEMQRIAKSLKTVGLQTDRIYTSPLRRARETAEITARILKIPILEEWDELKPDGSKQALYRKLARLEQDSRPILVGHEPHLSSMIGEIIGTPDARIVLKKGGLARVRITSFTPRISGELRWLLTPKITAKMS